MKSFILVLASILVLIACTVPGPSDFESATKPLAGDEFLVVWRFSRVADEHHVLDKSQEHKVEMETAMEPLFQQLIPQLFSDIKEGKLVIREDDDIIELDEEPIKDLPSLMKEYYEGSWQNLRPFMQTFHITQRRNVFAEGYPAVELELELIAQDPEGKRPEKRLGAVSVGDLMELGYFIEIEGEKYDLISYLDKSIMYGFPISFFYQNNQNGLRTLEEAFGTKKLVLEGKWASIKWLAGEPNLTSMKLVPMPISTLDSYRGNYSFQPNQGFFFTQTESKDPIIARIEISTDSPRSATYHFSQNETYLWIEWSKNGRSFKVFPTHDHSFFTTTGIRIFFKKMEDGRMKVTLTDSKGLETVGYRN